MKPAMRTKQTATNRRLFATVEEVIDWKKSNKLVESVSINSRYIHIDIIYTIFRSAPKEKEADEIV